MTPGMRSITCNWRAGSGWAIETLFRTKIRRVDPSSLIGCVSSRRATCSVTSRNRLTATLETDRANLRLLRKAFFVMKEATVIRWPPLSEGGTCLARCTQVALVPEGQRIIAGGKRACERSPRMGGRMDFAPWKGAGRTGRNQGQTKSRICVLSPAPFQGAGPFWASYPGAALAEGELAPGDFPGSLRDQGRGGPPPKSLASRARAAGMG